jgi:hypothetical protein
MIRLLIHCAGNLIECYIMVECRQIVKLSRKCNVLVLNLRSMHCPVLSTGTISPIRCVVSKGVFIAGKNKDCIHLELENKCRWTNNHWFVCELLNGLKGLNLLNWSVWGFPWGS